MSKQSSSFIVIPPVGLNNLLSDRIKPVQTDYFIQSPPPSKNMFVLLIGILTITPAPPPSGISGINIDPAVSPKIHLVEVFQETNS